MYFSFFQKIFINTFVSAEAESLQWQNDAQSKRADTRTILVCVLTALCTALHWYFSDSSYLYRLFDTSAIHNRNDIQLMELSWWVALLILFYFIVPVLCIKLVFKQHLSEYGLKLKGAFNDYQLYVVMLMVMVPLVLYFSTTAAFQARYPFYQLQPNEGLFPNLFIWELIYFLQFVAVEFFFRGFMVHGTKHRFGYYSVFVMTIPYCMVHFGKPLPETIAAIIAGVVLGTLSLKSRSVWLGVAIHYSVAITMDMAALWQKGFL